MQTETGTSLLDYTLPPPATCHIQGAPYNAGHCLAVYYHAEGDDTSLQLPAILAGEAAAARSGQGCTLLEGVPAKPPGGCVVVGLWEPLSTARPDLLEGLAPPKGENGYVLRLDHYALLVANTRAGALWAAQTFVQLLAAASTRELTGLVIEDAPVCERRSLLYDARGHQVRADGFMRLAALMSSFKANRLHLLLNTDLVTGNSASATMLSAQDASQLQQVCEEYCVELVPWLDFSAAMKDQQIDAHDAIDAALAFSDIFHSSAVGLLTGSACMPENESVLSELIAPLLQQDEGPEEVYLDADIIEVVSQNLPTGQRSRLIAVLNQTKNAYDQATRLRDQQLRLAVFTPSMSEGFVPALLDEERGSIDMAASLARTLEAEELGYSCRILQRGHLWENDLPQCIATLALGWGGVASAGQALNRFSQLAYGEAGELVMMTRQAVCEAFPAELRGTENKDLRSAAFGYPVNNEAWRRLRSLNWEQIAQATEQVENAIRICRNNLQRNGETLDYLDVGIASLRFLGEIVSALSQGRAHYAAARQGRAGSLVLATQAIEHLQQLGPVFISRMEIVHEATGGCIQEISQCRMFMQQIAATREAMSSLKNADDLPAPESLGLPPG